MDTSDISTSISDSVPFSLSHPFHVTVASELQLAIINYSFSRTSNLINTVAARIMKSCFLFFSFLYLELPSYY